MANMALSGLAVVMLLANSFVVGCAGGSDEPSSSSSSNVTAPLQLSGQYDSTTTGSAIKSMTFIDGARANVVWASCGNGASCTRASTYALSNGNTKLAITDATTKKVTTLAFKSLSQDTSLLAGQSLGVRDDSSSLVNSGGSLVDAGSTPVAKPSDQPLVKNYSTTDDSGGETDYSKNPQPDPTEPKANQANTPESPYDCVGGVCIFDDSSMWQSVRASDIVGVPTF